MLGDLDNHEKLCLFLQALRVLYRMFVHIPRLRPIGERDFRRLCQPFSQHFTKSLGFIFHMACFGKPFFPKAQVAPDLHFILYNSSNPFSKTKSFALISFVDELFYMFCYVVYPGFPSCVIIPARADRSEGLCGIVSLISP